MVKLIQKKDYREFETIQPYDTPSSVALKILTKSTIPEYLETHCEPGDFDYRRSDVGFTYYILVFKNIQDAQLFELAFAQHISYNGYRYD